MKPIKSLVLLGVLAAIPVLAPTEAAAQPRGYYGPGFGPPPDGRLPGGFWNRQGRLIFGFSGGVGGMHDDVGPIGDSTVAGMISGHIGGFIGPRLALMLELQANAQQLGTDQFGGSVSLVQGAAMVAARYWLTPQLWIGGGIGVANLQIQDEFGGVGEVASNGLAIMGKAGFELFSSRFLSIDLQGRIINGSYDGTGDNITSATIGVGINWF